MLKTLQLELLLEQTSTTAQVWLRNSGEAG